MAAKEKALLALLALLPGALEEADEVGLLAWEEAEEEPESFEVETTGLLTPPELPPEEPEDDEAALELRHEVSLPGLTLTLRRRKREVGVGAREARSAQ